MFKDIKMEKPSKRLDEKTALSIADLFLDFDELLYVKIKKTINDYFLQNKKGE